MCRSRCCRSRRRRRLSTGPNPPHITIAEIELQNHRGEKQYFKEELLRWHPDKFFARYGRYIDAAELPAIEARVKETFQLVNEASNRQG